MGTSTLTATAYPYTQQAFLVNSITATTVVSIVSGMQVSKTTFTSPAGDFGSISLSPVQPTAQNVQYQRGNQILRISLISFRAAFGMDQGQVTCNGDATDQDGKNDAAFSSQICSWS